VTATGTELLHGDTVAGSLTVPAGDVRVVMTPARTESAGRKNHAVANSTSETYALPMRFL